MSVDYSRFYLVGGHTTGTALYCLDCDGPHDKLDWLDTDEPCPSLEEMIRVAYAHAARVHCCPRCTKSPQRATPGIRVDCHEDCGDRAMGDHSHWRCERGHVWLRWEESGELDFDLTQVVASLVPMLAAPAATPPGDAAFHDIVAYGAPLGPQDPEPPAFFFRNRTLRRRPYADGWWGLRTIEWGPTERAAWVEEVAERLRDAVRAAEAGEAIVWGEPPMPDDPREAHIAAAAHHGFEHVEPPPPLTVADVEATGLPPEAVDWTFEQLQRFACVQLGIDYYLTFDRKMREDGDPLWAFIPPPTAEEARAFAERVLDEADDT